MSMGIKECTKRLIDIDYKGALINILDTLQIASRNSQMQYIIISDVSN